MCTYNFIYTYTHTSYNYTFIISIYIYIYIYRDNYIYIHTHGGMSVAKLDYQSAMQLVLHLGYGSYKESSCNSVRTSDHQRPWFPYNRCQETLCINPGGLQTMNPVRRKWGDLTWLVHLIGTKDAKQASYTGNYVCRLLPSLFNLHCFQI